jgi:hypothetical protein
MIKQISHLDLSEEEAQQDNFWYDCYIEDKVQEIRRRLNPRKYSHEEPEEFPREYRQEYL